MPVDQQNHWPQPRTLAKGDDEDDRLLYDSTSQMVSPATPDQIPRPALQVRTSSEDISQVLGIGNLRYERAAGVDVVADRLDIQRLRLDPNSPTSALSQVGALSSPTALRQTNASTRLPSTAVRSSPPNTDASLMVTLNPSAELFRQESRHSLEHQENSLSSNYGSHRIPPFKFHNTIRSTCAMKSIVEGIDCATTDRFVSAVPLDVGVNKSAHNHAEMDLDLDVIEPDDNLDGDAEFEKLIIDQLMESRHGSGMVSMRRAGFPTHRSSEETALRCQNLVRNRPRMRKRTKLRDKSRQQPAISAASALPESRRPAGSSTSTS